MKIYLRHVEDDENDPFRPFDGPLTKQGKKEAFMLAEDLYQEYGFPDYIYCSPLLRCRSMSLLIQKYFQRNYNKHIPVKIDKNLVKYIYEIKKMSSLSKYLRPDTLEYKIIFPETNTSSTERIYDHLDKYRNTSKDYWFVTHSFLIKKILKNSSFDELLPFYDKGFIIE